MSCHLGFNVQHASTCSATEYCRYDQSMALHASSRSRHQYYETAWAYLYSMQAGWTAGPDAQCSVHAFCSWCSCDALMRAVRTCFHFRVSVCSCASYAAYAGSTVRPMHMDCGDCTVHTCGACLLALA